VKILIATPIPPAGDAPGAIGRVLHAQLVGLAERNEVTVATVAGPEEFELEAVERLARSGVDVHAARRTDPRGAERWRRRRRLAARWLRGREPWRTVWYWEPALQATIDGLLARRRFDVVAVEDNAMGPYAFGSSTPTVFTEHEVRRPRRPRLPRGSPAELARGLLAEQDWQRWRRYQLRVWRRFAIVQVFTERDAARITSLAPDLAGRLRVTPFGIDLPAAIAPAPDSSRELLFFGNYTHPPNIDGALWLGREIMPILRERCPGVRLSLVGAWPPAGVRELSSSDVRVEGVVDDLTPYFERAAVVLAPLRIGGGMRMKVLEAMAFARAVVTTPRGAEGIAAAAPEAIVVADDAAGLAEAVARLLEAPAERNALGARARRAVEDGFSASAYARRLETVYEEAVALGSHANERRRAVE
jgi:glycosyltransferase involved in cell wall biosynthesis